MSLTVFLACIVYLLCRENLSTLSPLDFSTNMKEIKSILFLLNILFFGFLILSFIIWSRSVQPQPFILLLIASIISSILAVEIFYNNNRAYSAFILVKLLMVGILLRAYPYFLFPLQAGVDSLYHVNFIEQLLLQGHIPINTSYESYPMTHIVAALLSQLTGLNVKNSFFFISIIAVLSLTFLFLIGRKLFNEKIGLLSVLVLGVSASQITLGWWITAMTLGLGLLSMFIFFLWSSREKGKEITYKVFILLLMIIVILTHPVPSTTVGILLGLTIIVSYLMYEILGGSAKSTQVTSIPLTAIFITMLLGYWRSISGFLDYHIASSMVSAFKVDRSLAIDVAPSMAIKNDVLESIWRSLPILIFLFFMIIGFLAIFRRNYTRQLPQIHYGILCACFVFFVSGIQLFKFYEALPGRWISFMEIISAFLVGIGLLVITNSTKEHRKLVAIFTLTMIFAIVMISSGISNVISITPWDSKPRMVLLDSERYAAERIYQLSVSEESNKNNIYVDSYVMWPYQYKNSTFTAQDAGDIFLGRQPLEGILILRKEVMDNTVLISSQGFTQEFRMDRFQFLSFIEGSEYNIIYDSGTVRAIKNRM